MDLVIFAAHYPFKPGEEYIVQELDVLLKYYKHITVICGEKNIFREKRVVPANVEVIIVNRKYRLIRCVIFGIIKMFSFNTLMELFYSKTELNSSISVNMIKRIFSYNVVSQRYVFWIKKNIDGNNADTTLYSYWLSEGAYALARIKKQGYKCKAISRAHGYDAFLDRGYQAYRREIYRYLNEIHFISEAGLNQFEENIILAKYSDKATLFTSRLGIINGVKSTNALIKKTENIFHIATCSAIIPLKRLDVLIEALSYLKEYNIKWTHFGDGNLKQEILNMISEKIKSNRIQIDFKGQMENTEILKFYENNYIDLFINISDYEGVPVSIMEALSYGIPTIARDIGGNSEIVINNRSGILLESEANALSLKNAIIYFINLPIKHIDLYRSEALKVWDEEYNAVVNYTKFAKQIIPT